MQRVGGITPPPTAGASNSLGKKPAVGANTTTGKTRMLGTFHGRGGAMFADRSLVKGLGYGVAAGVCWG